ncbi:MAG TPA: hypothetical protein V6D20_08500 [Candidatus Obscuribacterales bacterium]
MVNANGRGTWSHEEADFEGQALALHSGGLYVVGRKDGEAVLLTCNLKAPCTVVATFGAATSTAVLSSGPTSAVLVENSGVVSGYLIDNPTTAVFTKGDKPASNTLEATRMTQLSGRVVELQGSLTELYQIGSTSPPISLARSLAKVRAFGSPPRTTLFRRQMEMSSGLQGPRLSKGSILNAPRIQPP